MLNRRSLAVALAISALIPIPAQAAQNGIVEGKSAYSMSETIDRLKKDVAAKGITFFAEIDQTKLAADAGIKLGPSTLLIFGNPALGSQFMTSNPQAGIDWPVRLLVIEDKNGQVWTIYNDFGYIARRHHISNRAAAFKMASEVIASITSSVKK
ncbi:DUF302 domain-containing protein [Nordella sp. HKS 07]|uniref:DUF302 domain-containing protein n=1 Tax=Nordella sp. HKS 07 TaxID=2712222 RepID=UPI0013E150B8|nr:DUF302 domain-containing protein [Nordella sp. HKS 07]QIG51523.1 DUF302 domain-containing protein [Nordella sp. HKS 07]